MKLTLAELRRSQLRRLTTNLLIDDPEFLGCSGRTVAAMAVRRSNLLFEPKGPQRQEWNPRSGELGHLDVRRTQPRRDGHFAEHRHIAGVGNPVTGEADEGQRSDPSF